uniref:Pentatricopeptide repeat-containing protein n=1 Tax=Cannabis sativa TaxID=3483 RepID=A0A803NUM2_CANSA
MRSFTKLKSCAMAEPYSSNLKPLIPTSETSSSSLRSPRLLSFPELVISPNPIPFRYRNLLHQILRSNALQPPTSLNSSNGAPSPQILSTRLSYSIIFRILCRTGYLHEVPDLLDSMKGDGVVVDSETFKVLLDSFIRSGNFLSALKILDVMEELGASLNTQMYDSVIVALVRKNQLSLALSMFFKLLDDETYVPSFIACNELLVALRKADMRVEFKQFLINSERRMEMKASMDPDLCTYNSLLHVLCFVGKVKDALAVWEELKFSGHEPDEFTYRIIIQGCSKSYRIDDATKIFSEMQHNGFRPDTVVYNSLIDGLFKARKVNDACQLFEKMTQEGVRTSSWTYNILIDGLFRNGRAQAGYALFCDLKKKGQFVDGVTYSIVVLQLCKEGLLEEALELVEEMESRGFVVDLVTITSLLIEIYKQGRWDWTNRLMRHIRDGNLLPNVLRWKMDMEALLKKPPTKRKDYTPLFSSEGEFSEIMNIIRSADAKMEPELVQDTAKVKDEENIPNDVDQWSSSPYMDHLTDQVLSNDLFSQLFSLSRGKRVQSKEAAPFDINMVNTFLSIFLAKGNLSLACKLFEIFTDMGVNPVSYTYNSLMTSFVKKGYFDEAWDILNEMGEKVCPADIATYNLIIQGLGKMGRADLASAVLEKLIEQGGYLDVVMYNTLINALGKAGRIEEVNKFFEQMRASGISPDVVTYNTLIEVHTKAGRLKEAYKFLKMMLDAGCIPNHVTDTTLDFLGREIEKQRLEKASIMYNNHD